MVLLSFDIGVKQHDVKRTLASFCFDSPGKVGYFPVG